MVSCSQVGLYIQGPDSTPTILHNVFMVCKSPSIITNNQVDAFIALNEMQINEIGILILNNDSIVFENTIQQSHSDGIKIKCDKE